jgi:hypothetical protein
LLVTRFTSRGQKWGAGRAPGACPYERERVTFRMSYAHLSLILLSAFLETNQTKIAVIDRVNRLSLDSISYLAVARSGYGSQHSHKDPTCSGAGNPSGTRDSGRYPIRNLLDSAYTLAPSSYRNDNNATTRPPRHPPFSLHGRRNSATMRRACMKRGRMGNESVDCRTGRRSRRHSGRRAGLALEGRPPAELAARACLVFQRSGHRRPDLGGVTAHAGGICHADRTGAETAG